MSFRFIWVEADTPEELEKVDRMLDRYFSADENTETRKTVKSRAEINHENYMRRKSEKSEIQTFGSLKKSEKSLKKSEIQTELQEKEEKESTKEKEEKELINNTLAKAKVGSGKIQTSAEKPRLKPEDPNFWNFAKENAEMGRQFWVETGIFPVRTEFGRWVKDLRDLSEAGITISDMKNAVSYLRSKNIPIGAPGSVLRTARWIRNNPQTSASGSPPGVPKQNRWDKAKDVILADMSPADFWGMLGDGNNERVVDYDDGQ